MGVGRMWSPKTGWGNAKDVLEQNDLDVIEYKPKEVKGIENSIYFIRSYFIKGLTMINGTQFIAGLGAEGNTILFLEFVHSFCFILLAVERALLIAHQADIIAALSTEALRGSVRSLHPGEYLVLILRWKFVISFN